jgi:hypothetical protein
VKILMKMSIIFSLKTWAKNFGFFHHFFVFKVKILKRAKSAAKVSSFSTAVSVKKSVKTNGHFSSIFSLKNLKCSASEDVSTYFYFPRVILTEILIFAQDLNLSKMLPLLLS